MKWTLGHLGEIFVAFYQHVALSVVSVLIGLVVASLLALACAHRPRLYAVALTVSNLLFVIPSLALFAFLIPFLGLGAKPVIVGLSSYSLLILLRNIVTGLNSVPDEIVEAARGLGYTPRQTMLRIELPMSLPFILSGIRIALVTVVGIATVAAFIDGGGLGSIILIGLDQNRAEKIIVGSLLTSVLAIALDAGMSFAERKLVRWSVDR